MVTLSEEKRAARARVVDELFDNWQRRNRAKWDLEQANIERDELLAQGVALGMTRAALARAAKLSRKSVYKLVPRDSVDTAGD